MFRASGLLWRVCHHPRDATFVLTQNTSKVWHGVGFNPAEPHLYIFRFGLANWITSCKTERCLVSQTFSLLLGYDLNVIWLCTWFQVLGFSSCLYIWPGNLYMVSDNSYLAMVSCIILVNQFTWFHLCNLLQYLVLYPAFQLPFVIVLSSFMSIYTSIFSLVLVSSSSFWQGLTSHVLF